MSHFPPRANIFLLVNSSSGRGRALRSSEEVARTLSAANFTPCRYIIGADSTPLDQALASMHAAIIFGGDGTVHHALPALAQHRIPLFHAPMGTENLFAREFGTNIPDSQLPAAILERLRSHQPRTIDLGNVIFHPAPPLPRFPLAPQENCLPPLTQTPFSLLFALMFSIGPDASVVTRLAKDRSGPITHASYLKHILAEATSPYLPSLSLHTVDTLAVARQRGLLLIANSRQYALRTDPIPEACISDGQLNFAHFPASTTAATLTHLARARLRRRNPSTKVGTFTSATITLHTPHLFCQADGDAVSPPTTCIGRETVITISVLPRALCILAAAAANPAQR